MGAQRPSFPPKNHCQAEQAFSSQLERKASASRKFNFSSAPRDKAGLDFWTWIWVSIFLRFSSEFSGVLAQQHHLNWLSRCSDSSGLERFFGVVPACELERVWRGDKSVRWHACRVLNRWGTVRWAGWGIVQPWRRSRQPWRETYSGRGPGNCYSYADSSFLICLISTSLYWQCIFPNITMHNQQEPLKSPRVRLQQRNHLEELLACQICYCRAVNPTLCPHCSKLYCLDCMKTTLSMRSECPNCRQTIHTLTNCSRFLNQLTSIVSSLLDHEQQAGRCGEHGVSLNYYCEDCERSACCECKMFGTHQDHHFQPMALIYEEKYSRIRDLLTSLKGHLFRTEDDLQCIENDLIEIKQGTETHLQEIEDYLQQYRQKVLQQTQSQQYCQQTCSQTLGTQLTLLDSLKDQLAHYSEQAAKLHNYRIDFPLMNRIEEALLKTEELLTNSKKNPSLEEAAPPYAHFSLTLSPFSNQSTQPVTSEVFDYEGSKWRMLVYVEGDPIKHLSAFLELLSNPDDLRTYQYIVEVVNPEPSLNLVKQHQGTFEEKECLGYGKLVKVQELWDKNYVDKQTDSVTLVFGVRLCYYHDLSKRRQLLLQQVERQILEESRKIEQLESEVAHGSCTSISVEHQR